MQITIVIDTTTADPKDVQAILMAAARMNAGTAPSVTELPQGQGKTGPKAPNKKTEQPRADTEQIEEQKAIEREASSENMKEQGTEKSSITKADVDSLVEQYLSAGGAKAALKDILNQNDMKASQDLEKEENKHKIPAVYRAIKAIIDFAKTSA